MHNLHAGGINCQTSCVYLVHTSLPKQQRDFLRELDKSLFVDVDGGERLVQAKVDLGQVQVSVNHRLVGNRRLELSLRIAVHRQPANNVHAAGSQWSSGSMPDCSARGPGIESHCGQ